MAKSIRISDRLYGHANAVSAQQHRSLAQQVEHWAELGRALDQAGVTAAQVKALVGSDLRKRERALLKLGLAEPERMYLMPPELARETEVTLPELTEGRSGRRTR